MIVLPLSSAEQYIFFNKQHRSNFRRNLPYDLSSDRTSEIQPIITCDTSLERHWAAETYDMWMIIIAFRRAERWIFKCHHLEQFHDTSWFKQWQLGYTVKSIKKNKWWTIGNWWWYERTKHLETKFGTVNTKYLNWGLFIAIHHISVGLGYLKQ